MRPLHEVRYRLEEDIQRAQVPTTSRFHLSNAFVNSITLFDVIDLALYALGYLNLGIAYRELLHACASAIETKRGRVVCRVLKIENPQTRLEKYFRHSYFYPTIREDETFFQSRDWQLHRLWIRYYVLPKFAVYRDQHRTRWELALTTASIIAERIQANRAESTK